MNEEVVQRIEKMTKVMISLAEEQMVTGLPIKG